MGGYIYETVYLAKYAWQSVGVVFYHNYRKTHKEVVVPITRADFRTGRFSEEGATRVADEVIKQLPSVKNLRQTLIEKLMAL